ncbi:OmpA family protein [Pseudonocardia xishanensis]|uniref:OmpA-like domain-containing protein n=1 Tax=Pseudonocardia xishanensis TaxID=630995 RepID=A0ABP8RCL0_9PSEU
MSRLVPVALAATALTAALAACGGPAVPTGVDCAPAEGALVLVVGAHANAPLPDIPASLGCLIRSSIAAHRPIGVVGVDGTPEVDPRLAGKVFSLRTGNSAALTQDINAAAGSVVSAVRGLHPDSDGADVVSALGIAHDLAVSAGGGHATVVVLDPMLPDSGPLKLTEPGWAGADPTEVADHLERSGQLPRADGLSYELVGVGYTAAPQQPLPAAMRDNVSAIWTEVLRRGGAIVTVDPAPRQGDGPITPFTTRTVPLAEIAQPSLCAGRRLVFDNASALGFVADSAELRDPTGAAAALAGVADWLRGDAGRRADLVGTTARVGDSAGQVALSRRRAEAVAQALVGLGVAAGRLHVEGVGSDFDGYVPDAGDPAARQLNRTVRLTLSGPSTSC